MELIRHLLPIILQFLSKILSLRFQTLSLYQMEEEVSRAVQWFTCKVLEQLLESYDDHLMRQRDSRQWRLIHTKRRTILTSFGEICFRRRYYRDNKTGRRVFLLDEALGFAPRQRVSSRLREQMVALATAVSYHRAAHLLQTWVPGVSAMSVWQAVQEAGEQERRQAEAQQRLMFEQGEIPTGTRQVKELAVEADSVWVPARRKHGEKPRHVEVKLGVAYEGRTEKGRLKERKVNAGVMSPEDFWEQTAAMCSRTWDLCAVERCWLGSDGAAWLKQGMEVFPNAVYRLDRYHLRRALVEGLGGDSQGYAQVSQAIAAGKWDDVERGLREAFKRARKAQQKRIRALERYLKNNWEGIVQLPEAWRLGAIEGQVFHHLARRMKRHGARWSDRGADHLARVLAAKGSGELERLSGEKSERVSEERVRRVMRNWGRKLARAAGDWLEGGMPALQGAAAGRPWVKYVLRELSRLDQRLW